MCSIFSECSAVVVTVVDGWDISPLNLAESMVRAEVLDYELQQQLRQEMAVLVPRPGIYDPDFIAANQVRNFLLI